MVRYMAMLFAGNTMAIHAQGGNSARFTAFVPKEVSSEMYAHLGKPANGWLQMFKLWKQDADEPLTWETYSKYGIVRPADVTTAGVQTLEDAERQMRQELTKSRRERALADAVTIEGQHANTDVAEAVKEAAQRRKEALAMAAEGLNTGVTAEEMAALEETPESVEETTAETEVSVEAEAQAEEDGTIEGEPPLPNKASKARRRPVAASA